LHHSVYAHIFMCSTIFVGHKWLNVWVMDGIAIKSFNKFRISFKDSWWAAIVHSRYIIWKVWIAWKFIYSLEISMRIFVKPLLHLCTFPTKILGIWNSRLVIWKYFNINTLEIRDFQGKPGLQNTHFSEIYVFVS
jgi:hypothetical protein